MGEGGIKIEVIEKLVVEPKGRIKKKKKKLTEFSVKVGGWGQHRTNFPLIFFFFFEKKHKLKTLEIA